MGRYTFLIKDSVYSALNRVRDAFLAAKNGEDVEQIMKGILTFDERLKIGRRIQIAESLLAGESISEIISNLNVGRSTVAFVSRNLQEYERCFQIIVERKRKVEQEYKAKKFKKSGGSKLVFKKKGHSGFTRKDVSR
jgi:Trp operon repressor